MDGNNTFFCWMSIMIFFSILFSIKYLTLIKTLQTSVKVGHLQLNKSAIQKLILDLHRDQHLATNIELHMVNSMILIKISAWHFAFICSLKKQTNASTMGGAGASRSIIG